MLHLQLDGADGAVGLMASPRISSEPKQRLNVLVVVEDTLRADHLGAYGYGRETSPAVDGLTARSFMLCLRVEFEIKTVAVLGKRDQTVVPFVCAQDGCDRWTGR